MSSIVLSPGATGAAAFTIEAPSTATSRVITLPDATDTLVGKATTDTLTNKSIAATQLTGTVAAARMPAGSVIQVVQASTTTSTSTTSTSYADVTGLSATITPSNSANKILVLIDYVWAIQADNVTAGGVQILRGLTVLTTTTQAALSSVNANVRIAGRGAYNYLDLPITTSATTYKMQFARTSSAGTSYSFDISGSSGASTITLMEIVA